MKAVAAGLALFWIGFLCWLAVPRAAAEDLLTAPIELKPTVLNKTELWGHRGDPHWLTEAVDRLPIAALWDETAYVFQAQSEACTPSAGCGAFRALVEHLKALPEEARPAAVLGIDPSITFKDDEETHGSEDFWSTPYDTLTDKTGDSDDFALLHYHALLAAGTPADNLRFLIVRDRNQGNDAVALVLVAVGAKVLLLDHRHPVPLGLDQVTTRTPYYGGDQVYWYVYRSTLAW
jgi:hypothetical protein